MLNLDAEMARNGVKNSDLGKLLGYSQRTIQHKRKNASAFCVRDAIKIRDEFFPGLRIEYLFADSGEEGNESDV